MKIISGEVTDTACVLDEISDSTCRAVTGRVVARCSEYQNECSLLVHEWFECEDVGKFRSHPTLKQFSEAIGKCSVIKLPIVFYRGRWLSYNKTVDELEFGPPPEQVPSNRYNERGYPALYLSESCGGVEAELGEGTWEDPFLYAQKYTVNDNSLRLADLANDSLDAMVLMAFDESELNKHPEYYWKSQILAEVVAQSGFNGMMMPGVRGHKDNRYKNLIIFNPSSKWKEWVDKGSKPQLLQSYNNVER